VLENLTNIRERVTHRKGEGQRRLHSWSFAQFHAFLFYKAEARGIQVVKISKSTPGIPRRPVRAVGIKPAIIVVLKASSFVVGVNTA
jgi:hypothetical protein